MGGSGGYADVGPEGEPNQDGCAPRLPIDDPAYVRNRRIEPEPGRTVPTVAREIDGDAPELAGQPVHLRLPHAPVGAGPVQEHERPPLPDHIEGGHVATRYTAAAKPNCSPASSPAAANSSPSATTRAANSSARSRAIRTE